MTRPEGSRFGLRICFVIGTFVIRHSRAAGRTAMQKTQIRIVAGSLRGRKLTVVVHPGLRPTPQRVREALFSILGNAVPGRVFYDVFAGTRGGGIEALSPGGA